MFLFFYKGACGAEACWARVFSTTNEKKKEFFYVLLRVLFQAVF